METKIDHSNSLSPDRRVHHDDQSDDDQILDGQNDSNQSSSSAISFPKGGGQLHTVHVDAQKMSKLEGIMQGNSRDGLPSTERCIGFNPSGGFGDLLVQQEQFH
eukprot:GABV01007269.1.p1 GENE.GABV01007269.1~~GABV01007269.1.p1  ORF type:complete len:104 (-),score=37.50 GABV01007269.1:11-322(-)